MGKTSKKNDTTEILMGKMLDEMNELRVEMKKMTEHTNRISIALWKNIKAVYDTLADRLPEPIYFRPKNGEHQEDRR